jgi:hypothetical protein
MNYNNPNDLWGYDPYSDLNDEERMHAGCMQGVITAIAIIIITMIIMALFSGCTTTKEVIVEKVRTDTVWKNRVQRDSIVLKDSTRVSERGDTVKIEHWHTQLVKKEVHDTTYISKTDTIPKPYPVEKEVPADLTWWQQARLHMMNGILLLLAIWVVIWLLRKKIVSFLR